MFLSDIEKSTHAYVLFIWLLEARLRQVVTGQSEVVRLTCHSTRPLHYYCNVLPLSYLNIIDQRRLLSDKRLTVRTLL